MTKQQALYTPASDGRAYLRVLLFGAIYTPLMCSFSVVSLLGEAFRMDAILAATAFSSIVASPLGMLCSCVGLFVLSRGAVSRRRLHLRATGLGALAGLLCGGCLLQPEISGNTMLHALLVYSGLLGAGGGWLLPWIAGSQERSPRSAPALPVGAGASQLR